MKTAIAKVVRWTTPSCDKRRTATRDVELAGRKIRAGDKVTYGELSANRGESVFEALLERDEGFEFAGPHEWVENNRLFGLKRLPIRAF